MEEKVLKEAVSMAVSGIKIVATCNERGVPHMAAIGKLTQTGTNQIALTDWFCPGTVANATPGRALSVVVWDPECDIGYQLLGRVVSVKELAVMDGYSPEEEKSRPLPQVERMLIMDVEKILAFKKAPHTDSEQ